MKKNLTLKPKPTAIIQTKGHNNSFACVIYATMLHSYKFILEEENKDFDVIEESLGE